MPSQCQTASAEVAVSATPDDVESPAGAASSADVAADDVEADDEADDPRHVALLQPEAWAHVTIKSAWGSVHSQGCNMFPSELHVNITKANHMIGLICCFNGKSSRNAVDVAGRESMYVSLEKPA